MDFETNNPIFNTIIETILVGALIVEGFFHEISYADKLRKYRLLNSFHKRQILSFARSLGYDFEDYEAFEEWFLDNQNRSDSNTL